ncbi:MAG: hypothetical protein ACI83O_000363 [Patescibacteria group bacterium]|jgi:hypothetical protein
MHEYIPHRPHLEAANYLVPRLPTSSLEREVENIPMEHTLVTAQRTTSQRRTKAYSQKSHQTKQNSYISPFHYQHSQASQVQILSYRNEINTATIGDATNYREKNQGKKPYGEIDGHPYALNG